jgi:hypothetical protein
MVYEIIRKFEVRDPDFNPIKTFFTRQDADEFVVHLNRAFNSGVESMTSTKPNAESTMENK